MNFKSQSTVSIFVFCALVLKPKFLEITFKRWTGSKNVPAFSLMLAVFNQFRYDKLNCVQLDCSLPVEPLFALAPLVFS